MRLNSGTENKSSNLIKNNLTLLCVCIRTRLCPFQNRQREEAETQYMVPLLDHIIRGSRNLEKCIYSHKL